MPQNQARDARKILFVSGKGGVGKSLMAAAIARAQAQAGSRVLLAEIGDKSYYQDFWNLPEVTYAPRPSGFGFDVALWNGESALREYVLFYLKLERLYGLFFENKVMRSLISVAPGLNEIAILGKITSGLRKVGPPLEYDLIVVDSYATGHALSLLRAPRGMMEAIKFGPMGHHSREMEKVLHDPTLTGYVAVSLLEEMPVTETLEFCRELAAEVGFKPEVVANKVMPAPASHDELSAIAREPKGLGEFARYVDAMITRQAAFLKELTPAGATAPKEVPLFFTNDPKELLDRAAGSLA